ncbi:MAG TPA: hypothetical protein VGM30_02535 [Puia sp.]|jgi:hypothetical protein
MLSPNKDKPSQIAKLIEYASADTTNTHQEINFGNVPNFQAQEINFKTEIKINGAVKIMSSSGIIHTIKRHGDDKEESKRGQKGITNSDFELIPSILATPDSVNKGIVTGRGDQSLVFVKKINSFEYYVVMAVKKNDANIRLFFTTMYAKKIQKPM